MELAPYIDEQRLTVNPAATANSTSKPLVTTGADVELSGLIISGESS